MEALELQDLTKKYQIQIIEEEFNFSFQIIEIVSLNNDIVVRSVFTGDHAPHYYKYNSIAKCLEVADRVIKRITQDKGFNMETVDLRKCPKRYEIHIKKEHFNYAFIIVQVTQLNESLLVAESLQIDYAPDGGIYPSLEETVAAALTVMERIAQDADIEVKVETITEDSPE